MFGEGHPADLLGSQGEIGPLKTYVSTTSYSAQRLVELTPRWDSKPQRRLYWTPVRFQGIRTRGSPKCRPSRHNLRCR
jgi:hypothetical protein